MAEAIVADLRMLRTQDAQLGGLRAEYGTRWRSPMAARLDNRGHSGGRGSGDRTCALPEHWLFEWTEMKKADSVKGLIGWEWHGAPAMDLPGINAVAEGNAFINEKKAGCYTATIYDGTRTTSFSTPPRSGGPMACPALRGISIPQDMGSPNKG